MTRFFRSGKESGQATVETALVSVVVMALALGVLQFGLFYHAQHVVLGAAQEGARLAALDGSEPGDGETRATKLVSAGLGSLARVTSVSEKKTPRVAVVSVRASLPTIVFFLSPLSLSAEARAFRERFVSAGEAP